MPETNVAVIVLVTEDPESTDLFPEWEREKSKGVVGFNTVRLKEVDLVIPPPAAVTVIGKLPPEVAVVVLTVNREEQLRLQVTCEKDAVAPEGNPAIEKAIG